MVACSRQASGRLMAWILALMLLQCCAVSSGQGDQWSGFVNQFSSLLDFSCPNRTVVTGIASDFDRFSFDRRWEFRCGTGGGLASVQTNCTLQGVINSLQGDIDFSCPDGGYLGGFRSVFTASRFDRLWEPYCCVRPASALINCQTPSFRYENVLRSNLNFSAPAADQVIVGVQSFYFNRDRRWRYETCEIEVNCGDPGVPANGRRIGDRFLYGDVVEFECDDGYYQSSGPLNGSRECLITGQWSDTQPVCSECGAIESCEQVLCSNETDHRCDLCVSNTGHLDSQQAYENLMTECRARCSWLRSFCYPGDCPDVPESCDCMDGFQGPNCLQITDSPVLAPCMLRVLGADNAELSTSCLPSNDSSPIFTNIRPQRVMGMWEGRYSGPGNTPPFPAYIDDYLVGVAVSEMVASLSRAANPNDVVSESRHGCGLAPPTPDDPMSGLVDCTASATPTSLENHTFLHGDMFEISVGVEAGGYLDVINLDTNVTTRHYYTGSPTLGGAVLVLDFQPPTHCTLTPAACPLADQPLLSLDGELVSSPNVTAMWSGWRDVPSGVTGYVLTLYRLEVSGEQLLEGAMLETRVYNESGENLYYEDSILLGEEGAYSVVLLTQDNAGNIRYSRRLVLYDNTSMLNVDPNAPLIVTSALPQTNHLWQNSTQEAITVSGVGHFYNSLLRNQDLLSPVGTGHFNGSLTADYDHPLNTGRYPRNGTLNALGVVNLRYDYSIDQEGGRSLTFPDALRFESQDDVGVQDISVMPNLQDGDSVRVWLLARDYKGQEVNDSVLVHVDSSSPILSGLGLERNGVGDLNLHGTQSLTDMRVVFSAQDQHSGLMDLQWRIGTSPGSSDVGSGMVAPSNCSLSDCVCTPLELCTPVRHAFSPRMTDLSSPTHHDADYYITITATNYAYLSAHLSLVFTVDATPPLPGVVWDGPGPQEGGVADLDYQSNGTLTGSWSGFFDRESDILFYQYVFGRECANRTLFTYPLDSESVVMVTERTSATAIQPQGEGMYYLTVVAWNGALSPSTPVCSDGITIDTTPPVFQGVVIPGGVVEAGLVRDAEGRVWLIERGRERVRVEADPACSDGATPVIDQFLSTIPINTALNSVSSEVCGTVGPYSTAQPILTTRHHTLNISWDANDNVGIREFYVGVASTQDEIGRGLEAELACSSGQKHYSMTDQTLLRNGNQFFVTVRAEDLTGYRTTVTFGPILIDLSPPLVNGSLLIQQTQSHVIVTWDEGAIMETEDVNGTIALQYGIGLRSYSDEVVSFRPLPLTTPPACPHRQCIAVDITSEATPLANGKSYHFTISATNRAGLTAFLTSDPYYHDTATPSPGLVVDFDPSASVEIVSGRSFHFAEVDVLLEGSALGVRWAGFRHPTAAVEYSVALGLSQGSEDTYPFTSVPSQVSSFVFEGVALQEGSTYYATVVANTGFSTANRSSNGVLVYREGGVAASGQAVVRDGTADVDVDYQLSQSQVSAHWIFPAHLHAQISHYQWGLVRTPGESPPAEEGGASGSGMGPDSSGSGSNVLESDLVPGMGQGGTWIRGYQNVGKDVRGVASVSGLRADGSVYRSVVRACFASKCLPPVMSDGFQISVPPRPGSINATFSPILFDEVYGVASAGTLELEWEEFRDPQLAYYEWALVGGAEEAGLLAGWNRVEWFRNSVTVTLNTTVSLHGVNSVTLRGVNSVGLYASTSTGLQWRVRGRVTPQEDVPRPSLVVYDTDGLRAVSNPAEMGWRQQDSRQQDIQYTRSESTLSGAWPDLRYRQYNYSVSLEQRFLPCHSEGALACGTTPLNAASVSNLALRDGERYYFCVQTSREFAIHTTPATPPSLEVCSNGVTVDLTPPLGRCIKIITPAGHMTWGEGISLGERACSDLNDTLFQVSTSELFLVWAEFDDVEGRGNAVHASEVAQYSYAIGTSPNGMDVVNFTSVGVATSAVVQGLSLQSGLTYYATVRAVDFTGQSSSVVSRGVSIDTTEPSVEGVELLGLTQFHSTLRLAWNGVVDEGSGVRDMEWGLGSRPGSSDIAGWSPVSLGHNTGLDINTTQLNLYDGQTLFASLKLRDGAGVVSVMSSPAYTLDSSPPDVGGVFDGALPPDSPGGVDMEYWSDAEVLEAHWRGFSDPHSTITEFWWAIGTCPHCTDIQPWISIGIQQDVSRRDLALSAGGRYYASIRACNALGLCSNATSDGATLDATPPSRGRVLDSLMGGDKQFQSSPFAVSAHWDSFHDSQSQLSHFVYYVGLSPNASDLISPTTVPASHTSFLHPLATPLTTGTWVFTSVVGYNRAGLSRAGYSDGVVVDGMAPMVITPPRIVTSWVGSLSNRTQHSGSAIKMEWEFVDSLHWVQYYFLSMVSEPGTRVPVAPQLVLNAERLTLSSLALSDGSSYRVKVIGCDVGGVCASPAPSDPVLVDSSPPIDGYFAVSSESVANLSLARTVPGGMTWRNRPVRGVAELNLAFLGFSDPHSSIVEYWTMVGSTLSGSDLLSPTVITPSVASNGSQPILLASVTVNRPLLITEAVYVSLWAVNGVGLRSHVVQAAFNVTAGAQQNNGSLVLLRSAQCSIDSCLGHCACAARGGLCHPPSTPSCSELPLSSLPTNRQLRVYSLSPQQATPTLPLFTSVTDSLYGRWELVDPNSTQIQRLEWSVGMRTDPTTPGAGLMDPSDVVWQDAGSAMSAVFRVSERYPLIEGQEYVFYVRAWYGRDEFSVFVSDGVLVDSIGPTTVRGRRVREGGRGSRDIDFSSSLTALSIAWDGVFPTQLSGNYSDIQVGIGTIPGSDNIYPLTSVDRGEVEADLRTLTLEEGVAYYSIARATNPLGVTTTSISDGIIVDSTPPDVGGVVSGRGTQYRGIMAQGNTEEFLMRWFGFEDAESSIHHYEVAVTNTTAPPTMYTDVGIGLAANVSGLSLVPGKSYYGHVVAVNGAGMRSSDAVSGGVAIQDQRPQGRVCQQTSSELLTNPSFDNDTENGIPCPTRPLDVAMATHSWDVNASYITVSTYPQAPPTIPEAPPIDGCFAVGLIGSISQSFPTLPGQTYLLRVTYRYMPLPLNAALRIQLPGVDRLEFHPDSFNGWSTAHVQFVAQDVASRLVLSSALSDSVVYIDHVTITWCTEYRPVSSTLSNTWPQVINLNHMVISGSKVRLSAWWDIVDDVGGVRDYQWAVGTVPGGGQLQQFQSTGPIPYGTTFPLDLLDTQEVHITVATRSHAGMELVVHSGPYLVDLSPPYTGGSAVWDGVGAQDADYQSSPVVGINWSGLVDRESGLQLCSWAIGTSPGLSDIQHYLPIPITSADNTTATSDLSLAVRHGMTVYSTVVCFNRGGLWSSLGTNGVTLIPDPPTSDHAHLSISSPAHTAYRPRQDYLPTAAVTLRWDGFAESAGTPLEYQLQVVESGGSLANWTSVAFVKMISIDELQLPENTTHAIYIRAVNLGGVASAAIQSTFAIVSSPPEDTGVPINASWSQGSILTLDWSDKFFSASPLYYEVSIGPQLGSGSVLKWVEVSAAGTSYSTSQGLLQRDGDYFVSLTAITSSGLHTTTSQLLAGMPLGV